MSVRLETTNGAHTKTIIITSTFPVDYYYAIRQSITKNISEYDFEELQITIKKFYKTENIVIDSRLEYLILATGLYYDDYCLVYDVTDNKTKTFYQYLSSRNILDQRGLFIYTINGKKMIDLYMFVRHFCTNLQIPWNTEKAMEVCRNNNTFISVVLNYIGIQHLKLQDNKRKANIILKMNEIVRGKFTKRELLFKDIDELYSILYDMNLMENTLIAYNDC